MKNDRPKNFRIDKEKCTKCGICYDICWNGCILKGESGYPQMPEREIKDEWFMCWECHRCLAYCPTGAISICGKDPANSYPIESAATGE
jgi:ferredoxin